MKKLYIPIIASVLAFSPIITFNPTLAKGEQTLNETRRRAIERSFEQIREINPEDAEKITGLKYLQTSILSPLGWQATNRGPNALIASYEGPRVSLRVFSEAFVNAPENVIASLRLYPHLDSSLSELEKNNIRQIIINHSSKGQLDAAFDNHSFTLSNLTKEDFASISRMIGDRAFLNFLDYAPDLNPSSRVAIERIAGKYNMGLADFANVAIK